jgi:SUKH-4 immunity protein
MVESFAERWRRKELACGFGDIASKIVVCGPDVLPDSAAPCVSFQEAARPVPVWKAFGPASAWSPEERERFESYRMIGSDGAGNPICVEQSTGAVVLLDHSDRFRTRQFVNTGVHQLAECLLAYMGEQDRERFRTAVLDIDPTAIAERSFWWHEAAVLSA